MRKHFFVQMPGPSSPEGRESSPPSPTGTSGLTSLMTDSHLCDHTNSLHPVRAPGCSRSGIQVLPSVSGVMTSDCASAAALFPACDGWRLYCISLRIHVVWMCHLHVRWLPSSSFTHSWVAGPLVPGSSWSKAHVSLLLRPRRHLVLSVWERRWTPDIGLKHFLSHKSSWGFYVTE